MVRPRARIRFGKQGDLRWIGHRDLARLFERLFRRAGVKLGMSQGFHPKPKIGFPSALAVGIEGLDEVMEVELAETCAAGELKARLQHCAVGGLAIASVEILPEGSGKAQLRGAHYEVRIPDDLLAEAAQQVARLAETVVAAAPPAETPDAALLRTTIESLSMRGNVLSMRLRASRRRSAGPRDVLAALGLGDLERRGEVLSRSRVDLEPESRRTETPPAAED